MEVPDDIVTAVRDAAKPEGQPLGHQIKSTASTTPVDGHSLRNGYVYDFGNACTWTSKIWGRIDISAIQMHALSR